MLLLQGSAPPWSQLLSHSLPIILSSPSDYFFLPKKKKNLIWQRCLFFSYSLAISQHCLITAPALTEELLSSAILSHPANFPNHPPIKLYKYIHLVNTPLTRSPYSIHNVLQSSAKSVTGAIMQLYSRQHALILIWGWRCTCQCSFTRLIHSQALHTICFALTYAALSCILIYRLCELPENMSSVLHLSRKGFRYWM